MTHWQPGDPERRAHGNPGLSGDVGELRGVLQQHLTQQMQLWSRFQDELREQREAHEKHLLEVKTKLDTVVQWKSEMTGGMKVAAMIWKVWAAAMTLAVAWLAYLKGAR